MVRAFMANFPWLDWACRAILAVCRAILICVGIGSRERRTLFIFSKVTDLIKTEFGIINEIDYSKDYGVYEPEKYNCVQIADDIYVNDWWDRLTLMKTFFHRMDRPAFALARFGVTIIPPESLPMFQEIVITDKRINTDSNLVDLANKIREAIERNRFMIHFGI